MRFLPDAISCVALLALFFGPVEFLRRRDCRTARRQGLGACSRHIHMGNPR
jgi:hypothetical protein